MASQARPVRRWNLFARELEDILVTHSMELDHLVEYASVSREAVRRLSQSLRTPGSFPILDADELESVVQSLTLSDEEVFRLRAAVLSTYIEKVLMERIDQSSALLIAEQTYPDILEALGKRFGDSGGTDVFRVGDSDPAEDDELDIILESALKSIDSANMDLQLSRNVSSYRERFEKVQQARTSFEEALAELDQVDKDMQTLQVWQYWYDKAHKGIAAVMERLEDLGVL